MRLSSLPLTLILLACRSAPESQASAETSKATSQALLPAPSATLRAEEWVNLMPEPSLAGFHRVPIDPLAAKGVWQVRADGSLFVDGAGAKEMLLSEREFSDGVLHVEWRFLPVEGTAPVFNGGVYVRTPPDGKSWVQLQVARADKPPVVGDLIAQPPGGVERVNVFQTGPSPAAAIGEWNSYDVTARGKSIELAVNGKSTVTWPDCPMPSGQVGLQAEGSPYEVRALRFKPL
jgi:Domain of Unknown Function (DUF1080)